MSLAIAPWKAYFTFFTNWGVVTTLITALFLTYCGSHGDSITQQKGKLACMHIIFEVAFAFNLIIVTVYWTVLHVHVIDDFEGASRLAMYLTHIFPAISLYFSWLSSENLYLSASHHILFLPIAIAYSIFNYYVTKLIGKPIYYFITWEDHTTLLIIAALYLAFILVWIMVAKLTQIAKKDDSKNQ